MRIDVDASSAAMLPGMFAEAEIEDRAATGSQPLIAVPESAVQTIDGQTVVFVPGKRDQNTFEKRPIQVGSEIGGMLPVLSGIEAGESIVTDGSFILKAELGKNQTEDED
ncbi:MAG: hypothetical protein HY000_11285 [Planctomycetes bacterium]|nr:hypothetical protein [Planctomycetota bacterium]